jgi:pyrroloquinoline quinone biosynthesis protein D
MTGVSPLVPKLAPHVSLRWQPARGEWLLVLPEEVVVLNETAAAVLSLVDGERPVESIVAGLREEYEDVEVADVTELLHDLAGRHLVVLS